ncbi:WD40-repeat-containing domain protein [Polychytrium aggregatum]|uniref:WD40-repeat-containing domain protein n=1 Tax=Polychytrium aggregatum TaxID=110093 RepID=UPI0022FEEEA6|nr:WD40-repeat-containing domain protein [Polychytrium aggregatum]KAI9204209.1 WD40-repeat-containing domain protein [Polychytrium aggregatum]
MLNSEYGPNVSNDAENFFQSDRDIELARQRDEKKSAIGSTAGNPVQLPSKILDFCFSSQSDGVSRIEAFVAESGHVARKVDLKTGKVLKTFRGHSGPVTSIAVVYDSTGVEAFVLTGSWDKTVRKWDIETETCVHIYKGHSDFVKSIVVAGAHFYSGSSDSTIRKWDLATGQNVLTLKEHSRSVESLTIDDDGEYLFSGSSDNTIKKWSLISGKLEATLTGHLTSIYRLIVRDGSLWSVSADKTARRWDLETMQADSTFLHSDFVKSIDIGDRYIFTGSRDENIRVWDIGTEKCVKIIQGHYGEISAIRLLGTKIWTASLDGTIRSWSILEEDIRALPDVTESIIEPVVDESELEPPVAAPKMMTEDEERELEELMGDD